MGQSPVRARVMMGMALMSNLRIFEVFLRVDALNVYKPDDLRMILTKCKNHCPAILILDKCAWLVLLIIINYSS